MKAKKSFVITLKSGFLLFSLYFLGDAFNRWDGYSFYMRLTEFLPELSLAFILWTLIGVSIAVFSWLAMYGFFRTIPKAVVPVRIEHTTVFLLFILSGFILLLVKKTFFNQFELTGFTSLRPPIIITTAGVLLAFFIWLLRKHAEKILYGLESRTAPLLWIFLLSLSLAVIVSIADHDTSASKVDPENISYSADSYNKRPNIVMVVMDTLTARDMQIYGYGRETTPFISDWAEDAIVFNKAYSSSNWTPPGTMSIMTGQRPWTHRVWYSVKDYPAQKYENNLPRILRDNGYDVYAFVQNAFASADSLGIGDAFSINDRYDKFSEKREGHDRLFFKLSRVFDDKPIVQKWIFGDNPIARAVITFQQREHDRYVTVKPPEKVYNSFLNFISNSKSQKPFFAWLHVLPPHEAYLPTKPYMGILGDADKFNSEKKQYRNFRFSQAYEQGKQNEIDILRKRYDEFILYSDQKFKRFLSDLAETVDINNTIIILTSDHGESFSHGWLAHTGPDLYESLIHIPLIIKIPGRSNNRAIDMPVEQIDIAPTILDFAGIDADDWMEGRSLVPLIEGKPEKMLPVFSMNLQENRIFDRITKGTIAVREGDYKLVYYLDDKKTLLFNTTADPDELINLAEERPELKERLVGIIKASLSKVNSRFMQ